MAAKKSKTKAKAKKSKPNTSKTKKASQRPRRVGKSQAAAAKTKAAGPQKTKTAPATANRTGKPQTAKPQTEGLLPSRDGVLVERVQEHDRTPGGLYIPVTAMEKPLKGLVVRAGRGKLSKRGKLQPLDVQPGDEVLFGKHAGTEIKIDGKEFLLIREDEILGVVS